MQPPPFHGNISFNAHHSPMGAYLSFTCGHFGTRGGLLAQAGKPANQDLYIGIKHGGRYSDAPVRCLPFYDGARIIDAQAAYTPEASTGKVPPLSAYSAAEISRHYSWTTDTWKAGLRAGAEPDFEFSLYTPFASIPDPAHASSAEMRAALLPAITAEITVDNRAGKETKTAFFAINFNEGGCRILDTGLTKGRVGFSLRSSYGVAAEAVEIRPDHSCVDSQDSGIHPFAIQRWSVPQGLADKSNPVHLLGPVPGIGVEVPPGKIVTLRLALACYLPGTVTTRLEGRYLYTRYFTDLLDVLGEALTYHRSVKADCDTLNDRLLLSGLNRDQQFLIAHSTRSYYGNTQLLDVAGQPYWIVNEGEYCMINTLDLSVDQMFWELQYNPWLVKNLLDNFVKFYSYHDQVKLVGAAPGALSPGGISFAHDQGANNQFSPFGTSSYEIKDLTDCFSYMTQEQLCNWILMAATYFAKTNDAAWVHANEPIIHACLQSMINRDHFDPAERTGMPQSDSSLCGTGSEITTYDSLDPSLAQNRNNLYMGVKCWASYLALALLAEPLKTLGTENNLAASALAQAKLVETTIAKQAAKNPIIPAVFEENNPGYKSWILPAIEGYMYPLFWKQTAQSPALQKLLATTLSPGAFPKLYAALFTHFTTLLSDPKQPNHYPNGGIRLSSTADNTWLSKIAIVQHIARQLFDITERGTKRPAASHPASGWEKSDAAHVQWLIRPPEQGGGDSAFWACSDQIINQIAKGSRYYPRIITTALWL